MQNVCPPERMFVYPQNFHAVEIFLVTESPKFWKPFEKKKMRNIFLISQIIPAIIDTHRGTGGPLPIPLWILCRLHPDNHHDVTILITLDTTTKYPTHSLSNIWNISLNVRTFSSERLFAKLNMKRNQK